MENNKTGEYYNMPFNKLLHVEAEDIDNIDINFSDKHDFSQVQQMPDNKNLLTSSESNQNNCHISENNFMNKIQEKIIQLILYYFLLI